jgi:hypothetical protein
LHLVKPAEGGGLDILVSATAVPSDDECLRLAAVLRHEILDTAPEAACDRITALAADLFSVPTSIIGFVDRDRIWFKSHRLKSRQPFCIAVPLRTSDRYDLGTLCVVDRKPIPVDARRTR